MSQTGPSTTACLHEVSTRLSDAAAVSKAAFALAETGSERETLQIIMDLDTLLHEATTRDGVVRLIGRITRAGEHRRSPDD